MFTMEMWQILNETHSWIMCNLLVSCTLEIFFHVFVLCNIHELYTCDCSPLCFIYLCSCNLLVCCILVSMLVLCNLHELAVYMWLFTSVFHLLVQLQFTCVLHTCVMLVLCNLHELVVYMWLFTSVFHILVQLQFTCVLHTCVDACALQFTWVRVVYMWLFTSVFHILLQLQFTCVLHTCVIFPEVSFQVSFTVGISLVNKVMNNSWTIVWPNVLQTYLDSSRQSWQMSWDTYEIISWKTLFAAFTKFWKGPETLAAMALRFISSKYLWFS